MKNELNEQDLAQVSGGAGGEHQVSIDVQMPHVEGTVIIKVYVDGVNDRSKNTVVDASVVSHKEFFFSGSGTGQVKFMFSNGTIYNYRVDFDNCIATRTS